ncbi:sugar ABC transporter substrate-binding protein [Oceanobacillus zhaokaii]|uniref:Sugar ABC transporter substrate-binding protein n=1 Tax=Oceanobacillus zhaokaii TaxID=2052660 RepID=A0A345PKF3_9BACI|nr:sugar ABC transporter substrate-binding protein [Oceanobacillus zhaokaii]AXI10483.1 sugar ABC transporter substrate-binding protein [Oceanobacillus zhaokaii]
MKKKISFIIIAGLLMLLVSGCNLGTNAENSSSDGNTNNDDEIKISVVLKTASTPYWKVMQAGAEKAAEELGVKLNIVGPPSEAEIMQQVNMIEDQLSQNPDAILVAPLQPPTVVTLLQDVEIPVITLDTDAIMDSRLSYIGTDNYSAGVTGAELLINDLSLKSEDKVALIDGAAGNPATNDRIKGAKDTFEAAGVTIAAEQPADSDSTKAMNVMENVLQVEKDLKAVFVASDDMALGALRAVEASGLDIKVVGVNGDQIAAESILNGGMYASIAQKPYEMGYLGVKNAVANLKGEKIEPRIDSGLDIIKKDNAQEQIDFLSNEVN